MSVATSPTTRFRAPRPFILRREEIRICDNRKLRAELNEELGECAQESSLVSRFKGAIIGDLLKKKVFRKTSVYVPQNALSRDAYETAYDDLHKIVEAHATK